MVIIAKVIFLFYFNQLNQKLIAAIDSGSIDEAKRLIEIGADVNTTGGKKTNAIIHAILKKDVDILKLLILKGADVNAKIYEPLPLIYTIKNILGVTYASDAFCAPITYAVMSKDIELVKILVENGADLSDKYNSSYPVLNTAAMYSNIDIFKYLIEKGAKVTPLSIHEGYSPLHSAIITDNYEIALLLADNKVFLNYKNGFRQTPLLMAIKHGRKKKYDFIKLLIGCGADVNISDDRYTPLTTAIIDGDTDSVKLLIAAGADLNLKDRYNTPLQVSIKFKKYDFSEMLLAAGADVDATDNFECPPLITAILWFADIETLQLLIRHKANVNIKDKKGDTPLIIASKLGCAEFVRLFIDAGADTGAKNKEGGDALSSAKNEKIKKMLNARR